MWIIALIKHVFMCGTIFLDNAMDGACRSYYTLNSRCDNLIGSLLFPFSDKLLYAFEYFCLFIFPLQMYTDAARTAKALLRCGQVVWGRLAPQDGFVSYNFETGEFIGLEVGTAPASK